MYIGLTDGTEQGEGTGIIVPQEIYVPRTLSFTQDLEPRRPPIEFRVNAKLGVNLKQLLDATWTGPGTGRENRNFKRNDYLLPFSMQRVDISYLTRMTIRINVCLFLSISS